MGYIKKLKNNELVGGTDKTTIYPVTSTKAVFEEVTEGNESSFKTQETINKEQQDELDDHEERIQAAEAEDIKSITINGSTKKFEVDDENNVDLTIYTVDSDPEMPSIADNVGELRNVVGTSTPVLETSHKTRIENLENTVGTGGTIDSRIATTRAELQEQIDTKQIQLHVGSGLTLDNNGNLSATLDPAMSKVVTAWPSQANAVKGLIYLKPTSTAGVYEQRVYNDSSYTTLDNITLNISTDDALNTGSANPLKNSTVAAQIGYFDHTGSNDNDGSSKVKNITATGFTLPATAGGAIKIKMKEPNTYAGTQADPVQLQFNNVTSTKKTLLYNHDYVSASNTWEANEVISVYFDGTNYQASNAQGGGSASGKKTLKPVNGYYDTTNVSTQGAIPSNPTSSGSSGTNYRCIKYAVNAGDVLFVSGQGSGYDAGKLWAWGDVNGNYMYGDETSSTQKTVVLVAPEGARWIVLNSKATADIAWYYAKKDSVGAHEIFIEQFIYGNLKELAVGQLYYENEVVKTSDKQLLRMTKEVWEMNLVDEVSVGDLKIYNGGTYQSQKAVSLYDGTKDPYYEEGDYAIGRPAIATIAFAVDSATVEALTEAVTITVTIVGKACTADVTSGSNAASVATDIKGAFDDLDAEGWELLDDGNGTLTLNSLVGFGTAPAVTSSVGASGVTVTPTTAAGGVNLSQYDGSAWTAVSLATWAADTSTDDPDTMWKTLVVSDLVAYTKNAYVPKLYDELGFNKDGSLTQEEITNQIVQPDIVYTNAADFGTFVNNYCITASGAWSKSSSTAAAGSKHGFYYRPVSEGETFIIKGHAELTGHYAWLADVSVTAQQLAHYAPGFDNRINIPVGQEIKIITPKGANFLYITYRNAGTVEYPQSIQVCKYLKEIVSEHSVSIKNLQQDLNEYALGNEEIDLSNYASQVRAIKVSDNRWTEDTDKRHKLIPADDFMCFKITAGVNYCVYAWLVDGSRGSNTYPNYATGAFGVKQIPAGETAYTTKKPIDANYLYLTITNVSNYTPSAVYGCGKIADTVDSNTARISALEGNTALTKEYIGGKIDMKTYHYDIEKWVSAGFAHQSGARWGDYYFMIADKFASVRVVDLSDGPSWYGNTWTNPNPFTDTIYHCNQCTFGTKYYDQNDPFPLLYITVNNVPSGQEYEGRCSQLVYRVIQSGSNFDFVHVQTIYLPVMTSDNCLGNANMAIDSDRNRMVFYSRDNNSENMWCKITEMNIPNFTPVENDTLQTVVLDDDDILHSYFISTTGVYTQGGCVYAGKLFFGRGGKSLGDGRIELIVVDLIQKCQVALINFRAYGFEKEPEGVFVYDDTIRMSAVTNSTTGDGIYTVKFE